MSNGSPLKMQPSKIYLPPDLKRQLKLLAVDRGCSMSHLVSEVLYSYVRMPEVKIPVVVPPKHEPKPTHGLSSSDENGPAFSPRRQS
jgi:hypothetical protein